MGTVILTNQSLVLAPHEANEIKVDVKFDNLVKEATSSLSSTASLFLELAVSIRGRLAPMIEAVLFLLHETCPIRDEACRISLVCTLELSKHPAKYDHRATSVSLGLSRDNKSGNLSLCLRHKKHSEGYPDKHCMLGS